MLAPKRVRHRKTHKGRMRGTGATEAASVSFGEYGHSDDLEPGWITNRQIESARVAITRHIKRGGKVWIRIFPDKPITQKPAETRMGKGKGNPEKLGRPRQTRPRDVRARGRVQRTSLKPRDEAGLGQAAGRDAFRRSANSQLGSVRPMKPSEDLRESHRTRSSVERVARS